MGKKVRTRFAPSPTGFLHVGGAYGALLDYAFAKKHGGEFLLRIEDTDQKRKVAGAEEKIYEALNWLGLKPDKGPYRQSERLEIYRKYAYQLVKEGKAYFCFCSPERLEKVRAEKRARGEPPMYDRCCRSLSAKECEQRRKKGEKCVIRMKIPANQKIVVPDLLRGEVVFDSNLIDDQVLLKSDGFPTYHLAVVVDDHLMEITHVIRGEEWLSSAPKHVLLYQYFGWELPVFVHTPTLRNEDRSKLSKRQGHTSLFWYQQEGILPEALLNFLALLGWSHPEGKEIFSLQEFIEKFDLKDISPLGPVFDLQKLLWMNGEYIRSKSDKELARLLAPFLPKLTSRQVTLAAPLVKERIKKLKEAADLLEFVWQRVDYPVKFLQVDPQAKIMLEEMKKIIQQMDLEETAKLQAAMLATIKKHHWQTGKFFMVLRVAICGKKITPPILESLPLLEKKEVLERLDLAQRKLRG